MEGSSAAAAPELVVRTLSFDDLERVMEISAGAPEAGLRRNEELERAAPPNDPPENALPPLGWVAELGGSVAGFVMASGAADEMEILTLAVDEAARRKGVGVALLRHVEAFFQARGAKKAYLEVRASNQGGIAFYERMGFRETGRRKNYYREPVEEAILMAKELT